MCLAHCKFEICSTVALQPIWWNTSKPWTPGATLSNKLYPQCLLLSYVMLTTTAITAVSKVMTMRVQKWNMEFNVKKCNIGASFIGVCVTALFFPVSEKIFTRRCILAQVIALSNVGAQLSLGCTAHHFALFQFLFEEITCNNSSWTALQCWTSLQTDKQSSCERKHNIEKLLWRLLSYTVGTFSKRHQLIFFESSISAPGYKWKMN